MESNREERKARHCHDAAGPIKRWQRQMRDQDHYAIMQSNSTSLTNPVRKSFSFPDYF